MDDQPRVVLYGQVDDGALHPLGEAVIDRSVGADSQVAALLRSLASRLDTDAAFLEFWARYDEA